VAKRLSNFDVQFKFTCCPTLD